MVSNIIKVVLFAVIVVLAYLLYQSVMGPVQFNNEVEKRKDAVIQNLKDVRSTQEAYKTIYGKFSSSFDTLTNFLLTGNIPVVKMIPDPTDTTFTKTIRDTIGYIPVKDSLFGRRNQFKIENIRFIPYSKNELFVLDGGVIEKGGVQVNVFECSAHYNTFLFDLEQQSVINLIAAKEQIDKFPGLKVGSMTEASTDGNWE